MSEMDEVTVSPGQLTTTISSARAAANGLRNETLSITATFDRLCEDQQKELVLSAIPRAQEMVRAALE